MDPNYQHEMCPVKFRGKVIWFKPAFYRWRSQTLKMLSSWAAEAQKAVYG